MKKWKLWAGLFVIFLSGILIGAFGTGILLKRQAPHFFSGRNPIVKSLIVRKLARELDLNDHQKERVERIVCRTHLEIGELRRRHRPEVEDIIQRSITEMKHELSADQQQKLDAFHARMRGHWMMEEKPDRASGTTNPCDE